MLTLELMRYTGLPQVMNKQPSVVTTLKGTFRQPYSLMNPVFEISGGGSQDQIVNGVINYARLDDKYYYLQDWRVGPNRIMELSLHLDVLMTYKEQIGDLEIMLERSSTSPNKDINDPMYPLSEQKGYEVVNFPRKFSDAEEDGVYILIVAQRGYTAVDGVQTLSVKGDDGNGDGSILDENVGGRSDSAFAGEVASDD